MRKSNVLKNGIWLTLPPLLFSLALMAFLPNSLTPVQFNADIPDALIDIESAGRILIFVMPAFFSVGLTTIMQKRGLAWYSVGILLYGLTYGIQNFFPKSAWSLSALGFAASAYTNVIWMIGLGLMGEKFYFSQRLRYHPFFYIFPSVIFVIVHTAHSVLYHQHMP